AEDSVLSPPLVSLARGAVVAALALLSSVRATPVREVARRAPLADEDGYDLWLRYRRLPTGARFTEYRRLLSQLVVEKHSPTLDAARDELVEGLRLLLDESIPVDNSLDTDGSIVIGTPTTSPIVASLGLTSQLKAAGDDGFVLRATRVNGKRVMVVA